jgi:hypothetical protein
LVFGSADCFRLYLSQGKNPKEQQNPKRELMQTNGITKRLVLLSLFATTLGMACLSAFAQGTLTFANAGPGCVFRSYDVSFGLPGVPLAGSGFMADLYWAAGTVTDSTTLAALNLPAPYNSGAQAGYFTGG